MKKSLLTAATLLLSLSIATGCAGEAAVTSQTPALLDPVDVPIYTTTVGYNDIAISSYYEATITPYVEEYAFPISGRVTELYFAVGDDVKKGDLLAELDHEAIDSQIESLQNQINSLKSSVEKENAKYSLTIEDLKLKKSNILSGKISSSNRNADAALIDTDIAIYETQIRQNTANLEYELAPLEERLLKLTESYPDYFIYAPMSGRVVYTASNPSVSNRTTVIAVADLQTKYIQTISSAENYISTARNLYAIHNGISYDIRHIPTIYDTGNKNIISAAGKFTNFIAIGDMSPFEFGDFVLIVVDTSFIESALSIPNTALYTDEAGSYVYLVSADGVKTRQDIITSITDSIHTVVLDGLKEGDVIYVPN